MAHFSRFVPIASLAVLPLLAGCPASEKKKPDHDPPEFAGLTGAIPVGAGTVQLGWDAADDRSKVTYRVWSAAAPGAEPFDQAPIAETGETTITIAGLPVGATPTYFVVRARDSHGNEDANVVERAVLFAENRLSVLGTYETPIASDIAVSTSSDIVAMGSFVTDPQIRAWIFDVSAPDDPELIATIYGEGRSTDVEIRGNVLWVATEYDPDDHGAYSYDITDPAAPVPLGSLSGTGLEECHTIWLDGDILYCASSSDTGDGDIHLVDVTDPANPVPRGNVGISTPIHDMYVKDGFAVGSFLWGGFAFLDVSDPDAPSVIHTEPYDDAFTHNAWPTGDGSHLLTTDETTNGHIRIWDVTNRAAPVQVGEYYADPGSTTHAIVHNVQVQGDLAYIAWYEAGVHVIDISNPASPLLVGWFDTWSEPTVGTFAGAWSAAPKGNRVYVSDFSSGLYIMELAP